MVHRTDNWPCVSRAEAVLLRQELVFLGQKGIWHLVRVKIAIRSDLGTAATAAVRPQPFPSAVLVGVGGGIPFSGSDPSKRDGGTLRG